MRRVFNKLVRDKIIGIIEEMGKQPAWYIAQKVEYKRQLLEKLKEEAQEYLEDPCDEEMADVLEVLHALCKVHGTTMEEVERVRLAKKEKRGGFEKHIILEYVDE